MADNPTLPATGEAVGTDDIAGVQYQRIKLIQGINGVNDGDVARTAPLSVNLPSVVSTANSTSSVLAGAAVFTGTSEDVSDYAQILVSVFTSHASATDGLSVQQSSDGTNWDVTDVYTIPVTAAGQGKTFSFQPAARYFRIVYTNGATLQTSFRLQTVFHRAPTKASSQRPSDAVSNENDFEQASTFGMVFNGTTWDRQRGDTANGIDVDVTRVIPGTVATALGKAEDAVAASGDTGVFTLGVIRATPAINAATGDYGEMAISPANGQFVAPSVIGVDIQGIPTLGTSVDYSSGDFMGTVITFTNAALASGRMIQIVGATVLDRAIQSVALTLLLFRASPTVASADNAALSITAANASTARFIGKIVFASTDYVGATSCSMCAGTVNGGQISIPAVTSGSANIFGVLVAGGTYNAAAAGDLEINLVANQF